MSNIAAMRQVLRRPSADLIVAVEAAAVVALVRSSEEGKA